MRSRAIGLIVALGCFGTAARADGPAATAAAPGASVSAAVATPSWSGWGGGPLVIGPARPGPGPIDYRPPVFWVPGPGGWTPYSPPLIVVAPGGGFPPPRPTPLLPPLELEPIVEPPEPWAAIPEVAPVVPTRPPRRADPDRAAKLITLGDRHFRARDFIRATGRYEQAVAADRTSGAARVRLAQVAIARRQYREAVLRLHEAQAAEPEWIAWADDVQGLYGEPAAFAAVIAELESHLQAHPEDRDACLVLGTELLLSGRTRQAADVLLRLTDREPGSVLAALLAAAGNAAP